jgi:ABC-type bacteriocin/lantibiotic exporter with double-glycine peptidase domain
VVHPERPAEALRGGRPDRPFGLLPSFHLHHDEARAHPSPIWRFIGLMRTEMPDIWTVITFSVITGVLYLALPLAVNALVSNLAFGGQSGPMAQALLVLGVALFACLALSAIVRGLQHYVAEVIQRRLFVRMAADLAYRLPRVEAAALDGVHAPEVVNRFLDVVTVQKSASLILLNGINAVLGALIGMVVLGFYHPFLLAYVVVLVAALGLIVFVLGRRAVSTAIGESVCKYEFVNWLEEIARYPRLFKGPGGYDLATERADQLARNYLTARRGHFRVLMRQIGGLLALEVFASAALLIVGGWLVINMQLTLGQLVASELIVSAIVVSVGKLGKQFEAWYDAVAAVDKLGHLVDLDIEREDGSSPAATAGGIAVEVRDLSFGYEKERPVFSNVNLTLAPGERVALRGGEGSGCSTLLDLLHGLRRLDRGYIAVDGLDLRSWMLELLRNQVMLIRSEDIVSGTVADNARLGRAEIGLDEIDRVLEQVGLLEDVRAMPDGLNTQLISGGLPLSSRQRTRLLLARALLMKPRLLLIDGVLDGLEPSCLASMADPVFDRSQPWTVLIATREPELAARCDRSFELSDAACHRPPASV